MGSGYVVLDPQAKVSVPGQHFVSESDGGVYDAEQGPKSDRHFACCFLNSDDYFSDCHVVHRITRNLVDHELNFMEYATEKVVEREYLSPPV